MNLIVNLAQEKKRYLFSFCHFLLFKDFCGKHLLLYMLNVLPCSSADWWLNWKLFVPSDIRN